jgi:transposase|tara:strand:- start:213 stop:569 length:357 start_codon:yes stop_codon:yes gene_type:complete
MKPLCEFKDIYLYRKSIDFRKQINGLSVLVLEELTVSLCDNSLFVFTNKHQNRIKLLYWDKTGFALWLKRLEKSRFRWPNTMDKRVVELSSQQLSWLLEGYDITTLKPHQSLTYKQFY